MNVRALVDSKILDKPVTRPTLFIWGTRDGVVASTVIEKQKAYIKAPFQELRLEAGHALVQEKENEVYKAILAHLKVKIEK
jgi:pimeloyl-ACP methyl ester carboxylesterase